MKRMCSTRLLTHLQARRGFTIVELLVVIVVIAILATIITVVYNGITQQAKVSAVMAAADQAAKKVTLYTVKNSEVLPMSLDDAGVIDGNATYQYRTYDDGRKYCITVTASGMSVYINNDTHTVPTKGACNGHGANGAEVITNLAQYPVADVDRVESNYWAISARYWPGQSNISVENSMDGPFTDTPYLRKTIKALNNPTTNGVFMFSTNTDVTVPIGENRGVFITGGRTYTFSVYMRASVPSYTQVFTCKFFDATGSFVSGCSCPIKGNAVTASGQWDRYACTFSAPVTANRILLRTGVHSSSSIGSTFDAAALMVTEGSVLYTFADGNSPGWAWSGAPNGSISTGPML